jgi:NAD(P)-dependent dehydrogenase (short-subunit alcohol dehydrogenase family)
MSDMLRIMVDNYAKLPLLATPATCSGKTYIVTGGNCGLGLETAKHLVQAQSSRVIITARDISKGEAAKKDIERTTGVNGVVEVWELDLASFKSVKRFAAKAQQSLERIDGLIENAGLFLDSWTVAEGMETTMTVNVVSTMLLGELLMPKLIETAKTYGTTPRLVFVTSPLGFLSGARNELKKAGKENILEGLENPKMQDMDQRYSSQQEHCKIASLTHQADTHSRSLLKCTLLEQWPRNIQSKKRTLSSI